MPGLQTNQYAPQATSARVFAKIGYYIRGPLRILWGGVPGGTPLLGMVPPLCSTIARWRCTAACDLPNAPFFSTPGAEHYIERSCVHVHIYYYAHTCTNSSAWCCCVVLCVVLCCVVLWRYYWMDKKRRSRPGISQWWWNTTGQDREREAVYMCIYYYTHTCTNSSSRRAGPAV